MSSTTVAHKGLTIERVFSTPDQHPFAECAWEKRDAIIHSATGEPVFEQKNVEVPASWSATATNIVASKYFHGIQGTPQRETSVKQVILRIVETITNWGQRDGYFATEEDAQTFAWELTWLLVNQYGAFNSPVYFNVGCDRYDPDFESRGWFWNSDSATVGFENVGYTRPQVSACFINSVKDTIESIMELAKTEVSLFRLGSGSGTNLSTIRGSAEKLSGGGIASGPLSFMKGYDSFAGVIKSGGKTRRAAKMVILNADHPDIEAFVVCKLKEEEKAYALMRAGYDGSTPDSEAYGTVSYQNANNSVRVTDEFMRLAADNSQPWLLKAVTDGRVVKQIPAGDLLRKIAEATWKCGDPGMQFDGAANAWHTCPNSGRINASNPCSEYLFLDDSSCNLASLNLMRFYYPTADEFDVQRFQAAVRIFVTAQDILVDNASYPTETTARNSHDFRPLGLGYANLGALLMARGLAYDSDEARGYAAALTAIMTGEAYCQSARLARDLPALKAATQALQETEGDHEDAPRLTGACPGWFANEEPFLNVILKHRVAAEQIRPVSGVPPEFYATAWQVWAEAYDMGSDFGYRNAQVTVLAPTGTIGFLMDCETTGIEPMLGLVTYKKLVGGGVMTLPNTTATLALVRLGYDPDRYFPAIPKYLAENGTLEGAPDFDPAHLAVFDCALKSTKGTRTISYLGHIRMMEAVQPFLSGGISKTINMPEEATVEDIMAAYMESWMRGLKSVAIYRNGSKKAQPVATTRPAPQAAPVDLNAPPKAVRHRLPDERSALTHKFVIAGYEGYLTVGLYANGQPGELFITMAKEGSTISGLMDAFAKSVSVGLQHGVPLATLVDKFAHMRFEPSGWTQNVDIGFAKSIMDYIFRWLDTRFLHPKQESLFPAAVPMVMTSAVTAPAPSAGAATDPPSLLDLGDAPSCPSCGALMSRNGSCWQCGTCGGTSGCS